MQRRVQELENKLESIERDRKQMISLAEEMLNIPALSSPDTKDFNLLTLETLSPNALVLMICEVVNRYKVIIYMLFTAVFLYYYLHFI